MRIFRTLAVAAVALFSLALFPSAAGQGAVAAERRLALVIGESAYPAKPIPTAANDAGLIAQTLQAAGFDVTGARDLEEAALKQAFRDFLDKVNEAGRDAVAFVYVSGYGLQLEGENYIVPVDAAITRDADIPLRALRVSDYLRPLSASAAKINMVTLDLARAHPFKLAGQPLAGGLSLYEPGGQTLLAFNAAPGTIAPEAKGDYGPYAHALAEMMRDGGRPLMDVFENTRVRVSETTKGAQIPWNSQRVETDFLFFQREAGAPPRKEDLARLAQPISALGPDDGFSAALRRDTLQGYQDYVATYPASPYAKRARAMAAARREALVWRRSRVMDTPDAYWTYLRRYPKGPHAWDARRRLAELRYEMEPPPDFAMVDYGYPPPPPEEIVFIEQPVVYFADPIWDFPPPPPPPIWFLPPPPPDFIVLPPPVVVVTPYVLPAPPYTPIPVWQRPPPYVAPPPNNFIYANMHNAVAVIPDENRVVVRNPAGAVISTEALTGAAVGAAAVGVGAALPGVITRRMAAPPAGMAPPPVPGAPGAPVPGVASPPVAPLPGVAPGAVPPLPGAERPVAAPADATRLPGLSPVGGAGSAINPKPGLPPGSRDAMPGALGGPADQPAGAAPGRERPVGRLPAGLPSDHALPQGTGGPRPSPRGPGADPAALPAPAGAESPSPIRGVRPGRRGLEGGALPAPAGGAALPAAGDGAPGAGAASPPTGQAGRRLSPPRERRGAGLEGRQLPSPARRERPDRITPGLEPGMVPDASSPLRDAPRNFRRAPASGLDESRGLTPPSGRMRGGAPESMGGEMQAPPRMRTRPVGVPDMPDMPGARGAPAGMTPMPEAPMRGMRREPRPEPMAPRSDPMPSPRYQGGPPPGARPMQDAMPPQMHEMQRQIMRAPPMERPSPPPGMAPGMAPGMQPGAMRAPVDPVRAAPSFPREERPRGGGRGGFGGPPGFDGMR